MEILLQLILEIFGEVILATLVLAPFAAAASMILLGGARARRGQQLVDLDRFAYAYLFALGLGIIRFIFAT